MTTEAQINANRENATHSTGPVTDAGKASSSQNRLTHGLYTREAYIKPEERAFYRDFCDGLLFDLKPDGALEKILASDVTSAAWRLRRCDIAEAQLGDPYNEVTGLWSEEVDKARRGIERARTSAQNCMNKALRELRKLQTQKQIGFELSGLENTGLVDYKEITEAHIKHAKTEKSTSRNDDNEEDALTMEAIHRYCSAGIPSDFLKGCPAE